MLKYLLFCAALIACCISTTLAFNANGFDFLFRSNPHAPRALFVSPKGNPILKYLVDTEVTFCMYVFFANYSDQAPLRETLFSYSCPEDKDEFKVEVWPRDGSYTSLFVKGENQASKIAPFRQKWTHLCFSWNSDGGVVKTYHDGVMMYQTNGLQAGKVLETYKGCLVLGQSQTRRGRNNTAEDGMRGKISHFNVWDKELNQFEVVEAANCALEGNMIAWSKANGSISGHADIVPSTTPCGAHFDNNSLSMTWYNWVPAPKISCVCK